MSNGMAGFLENIYNYLVEKFPDAPRTAIDEAAGYVTSRMMVEVSDTIRERDHMWEVLIQDSVNIKKYRPLPIPRSKLQKAEE